MKKTGDLVLHQPTRVCPVCKKSRSIGQWRKKAGCCSKCVGKSAPATVRPGTRRFLPETELVGFLPTPSFLAWLDSLSTAEMKKANLKKKKATP